ncbi:MAG: phosphoglycerate mutase, partial [Candidatus Woesearchaeota archaeon]
MLSLLGYDVFEIYTGRGPLEAIGGGVDFEDGNVAIRCNFGSFVDGEIKNVRVEDISTEESKKLEQAINEFVQLTNAEFVFKSTMKYRGVLVLKSKQKLSAKITNTHPGYALKPVISTHGSIQLSTALLHSEKKLQKSVPLERTKEASFTSELLNEFIKKSAEVLNNHPVNIERKAQGKEPANVILTRDAGDRLPNLFNLCKTYGLKWGCFAEMPVERGIAHLSGMEIIPLPERGNNPEKYYWIWAQTVIKNMQFYDALYIHV